MRLPRTTTSTNVNTTLPRTGSSGFSAQLAGALGLPFAFAAHFAPDNLEPADKGKWLSVEMQGMYA